MPQKPAFLTLVKIDNPFFRTKKTTKDRQLTADEGQLKVKREKEL
jgi:hypothetical protein